MAKKIDYIPVKAAFAQAEEWEEAIEAGIKEWLVPSNLGDRRKVIRLFNAMLSKAPSMEVSNDQQITVQTNRPSQHSEDSELHGPPLPKSECDPGYKRKDYHWEGGDNLFRSPHIHSRAPSQDREDDS